MKNISNRRKYKLFLKDIQRNKKDGYEKIQSFFVDKGVLINSYDVYYYFNKLTPDQFKRFMKLCTRIGGAAKKRNAFIKAVDVYNSVNTFSSFDPRKIPFYKCAITTQNFQRIIYSFSPENHEMVSEVFHKNIFKTKDETFISKTESSTLKEMLQLIK